MTMNLSLTASLASNYHSQRQVARVMTESWVEAICIVHAVETLPLGTLRIIVQ